MKATPFLPLLAALLATSLQAGVIPARWDKVDSLDLPVDVIVLLERREAGGGLADGPDGGISADSNTQG